MVWLALFLACGGSDDKSSSGTTDTVKTTDVYEPAGPLEVGVARVRMPVPVGIGTAGFGGFGIFADKTPFAEIYPGTQAIHGHPDFRVTVISRGEGHTVIFLRIDTVGMFQQLRRSVVLELEARTGRRDIDDALVIGATHTHSGPGRVIDSGGPFELIADRFLPEFYDNLVIAMADAVEAALDDLKPGRLGFAFADGSNSVSDRRCEDGLDYVNGALPVVAVEQEGVLRGLVLAHAIHGTMHGIEELTLSQDVSGGIEAAVSDALGAPVHVQMFNAWGADMRPDSSAGVSLQEGPGLADGLQGIAEVGQLVAADVSAVIDDLVWTDEPDIWTQTLRVAIDRKAIGYDDNTFPFDYGAVYCTAEGDCDPLTFEEGLDQVCLPFSEEYPAPNQTEFTMGQLGGLHFLTFPGEPGTLLAERVLDGVSAFAEGPVMFIGYSQDYLGYSILEDDWWQGGYEASGSLWGPRQGEYLADQAVAAFGEAVGQVDPVERPEPIAPFGDSTYTPYNLVPPIDLGNVILQPANAGPADLIQVTVAGLDPWAGAPVATLETAGGAAVLTASGAPLQSDLSVFRVVLEVSPKWAVEATERAFLWTFELPAQHPVVGAMPALAGEYRFRVNAADGTLLATSDVFTVSP